MFGDRHQSALKRALTLYLADDLDECEQAISALIAAMASPTSAAGRRTLGEAWECQARIEIDRGNHERAIQAFESAIDVLEHDVANGEMLGRVEYQLATEFEAPGYEHRARAMFARAREHLKDSSEYRMLVERIDLGWISGYEHELDPSWDWRAYRDRLVAALEEYHERLRALPLGRLRRRAASERDQLAWSITRTMTTLGVVLMRFGDDDEFRDGIELLLDRADIEAEEITDLEGWLAVLLPLAAVLDRPHVSLPERFESTLTAGETAAKRTGQLADLAALQFLRGIYHLNHDEAARALPHAIGAFAAATELFARTRNTMLRASQFLESLNQYQHLALLTAVRLRDERLAAELIEASRPQVLPASGGDPGEGDAPLGDPSYVTVQGVSVVQEAAQALCLPDRPTVALEDSIASVGGFHAWWWGAWLGMGKLFWATRSPDGEWCCGHRTLDEHASQAVLEIAAVYHREDEDGSMSASRWTAAAEQANAAVLSANFLPEPLKQALAEPRDIPLSLVVAARSLASSRFRHLPSAPTLKCESSSVPSSACSHQPPSCSERTRMRVAIRLARGL